MGRTIVILLFAASTALVYGQQDTEQLTVCATPGDYPEWLAEYLDSPHKFTARSADEIVYLPITMHSVGDSRGEGHYSTIKIFESICRLNKDFEPHNIQFILNEPIRKINRDLFYEHDNFSDGFKMMQSNKRALTINCFITKTAPNNACGYYHPSGDAIVVIQRCMGGSAHTLTHEVGHWLSLPHTFAGWEGVDYDPDGDTPDYLNINGRDTLFVETVSGANCDRAGDRFCDTPPDYLSVGWSCNGQFESVQIQIDPTGTDFRSDGTNFMSYSVDACQSSFSPMQAEAMRAYIDFARNFYIIDDPIIHDVVTDPVVGVKPVRDAKVGHQSIELEWEHHPNATHYLINISRFSFYATVDYEFIVEGNRINIGDLPVDKKYYWRVKPYNPYDLCSEFTDMGGFATYDITDIDEISSGNFIEIYPTILSTADPVLQIEFDYQENLDTKIDVYSVSGQMLRSVEYINPRRSFEALDLGPAPPGIYLARIATKKGALIKKLTVQ